MNPSRGARGFGGADGSARANNPEAFEKSLMPARGTNFTLLFA